MNNKENETMIDKFAHILSEQYHTMSELEAAKVILQALKSGDFMKYIKVDDSNAIPTFTYEPYKMYEIQKKEINRLNEIINKIKIYMSEIE